MDHEAFQTAPHETGLLGGPGLMDPRRCQAVAFECRSWRAFMAGECGICRDHQTECIYIGLNLERLPAKEKVMTEREMTQLEAENKGEAEKAEKEEEEDDDDNDDTVINGEHVEGENGTTGSTNQRNQASAKVSRGRHFVRSGSSEPHCRFHYQIVVAATPNGQSGQRLRHFQYLELPLGRAGNNQMRLVRVSHALRLGSPQHSRLATRLNQTDLEEPAEQLDLYTALVTFRWSVDCASSGRNQDDWALCGPIEGLSDARIWSSSVARVGRVKWVGVHLMSGSDQAARARGSATLRAGRPVQSREKLLEEQRPRLADLRASPPPPFSCLVGVVSELGRESSSQVNALCNRDDSELAFWAPLEPIKEPQVDQQ